MRSIIICLFMSMTMMAKAATVTKVLSGAWSDPLGWQIGGAACGCIPGPGDEVILNAGSLVVLDIDATVLSVEVTTSLFRVSAGKTLTLTAIDAPLTITSTLVNEGTIDIGAVTSGSPSAHIVGTLNNQSLITIGDNISGIALFVSGILSNNGIINSHATGLEGMFVTPSGTATNLSTLTFVGPNTSNGIDVAGQLTNSGTITIGNAMSHGIKLIPGSIFTNNSLIEIIQVGGEGIDADADIVNSGIIDIKQTGSNGISVSSGVVVDNSGEIVINGPTVGAGVLSLGTFNNTNLIDIKKTDNYGIAANLGTFTNDGNIIVGGDVKDVGVSITGTLVNNNSITVDQSTFSGIQVNSSGTLTNNSDIEINSSASIAFRMLGLTENFGTIVINQSLVPMNVFAIGTFLNHGLVDINDTNTGNFLNQGVFHNIDCGQLELHRRMFNTGTFENNAYILSDCNFDHSGSGTFNNYGIIKESGTKGFKNYTFTNDGYLLERIAGSHCEGDVISSVFSGTGLSANLISPISSTDAHSDVVATYDAGSNELTLLPSSFGLTQLFIKFAQGSCIKSIVLDFDEKIARKWFADSDNDGYGDPAVIVCDTINPAGYVLDNSDCSDIDSLIYPGAPERCNGLDDDCDGNPESLANVWTGLGDGTSWMDDDNWSEGYAPLSCQEVVLDIPSTVIRLYNGDTTQMQKFNIALASITLEIQSGAQMIVDNKGVIAFGQIINDGNLEINNSIGTAIDIYSDFSNNGMFRIMNSGNYGIKINPLIKFFNSGSIDIFGNVMNSAIFSEGEILNQPNSELSIYNIPVMSKCIEQNAGAFTAFIINDGSIRLDDGAYGIYNHTSASELTNMPTGVVEMKHLTKSAIDGGEFDNQGLITADNITETALLNVNNSINSGKIELTNIDSTAIAVNGVFVNLDSVIIDNTLQGIIVDGSEYDNQGTTSINMSAKHGITTTTGARYHNSGTTSVTASGIHAFTGDGELINGGSITINGASEKGINNGSVLENGMAGNIHIENTASQGIDLNSGLFLNDGIISFKNIQSDAIDLDLATGSLNNGTLTFQEGTLGYAINGTSTLINTVTGQIEGLGKIKGTKLNNLGILSPGPPFGQFDMIDVYDHVNGTLDIDLSGYAGAGMPMGYDALVSGDPILLGGTLNVNLAGGFEPVPGDLFTIVSAGSRVGTFTTANLPPAYCMVVDYSPNHVNISMPGLPTGTWSGTVDSDWFDPLNWVEGCVPGPNSDVTIVVSTSMPEIGHGKIARVNSVTIQPSATVTIVSGSDLIVN